MQRFRPLSDLRVVIQDPDGAAQSSIRRAAATSEIHNIMVHRTAEETLDALEGRKPPDAVLIHWKEPLEEGLRLCRGIRRPNDSPCPFVAILIIAPQATRHHIHTARNAGVDELLASPFSRAEFEQRLRAAVFERRPFIDVPTYFGPDRRTGAMASMLGVERRQNEAKPIRPPFGKR